MANIQELSKSELAQKVQSAYARMRSMRKEAAHAARIGTSSLLTVTGGAAAGALGVYAPKLPGTQISTDMAVGTALVTLAALDMLDGANEQAADIGSGMLAVAAARETQKLLLARAKK